MAGLAPEDRKTLTWSELTIEHEVPSVRSFVTVLTMMNTDKIRPVPARLCDQSARMRYDATLANRGLHCDRCNLR